MQARCMLLNINSAKVLNEGKTPVDTCDQPLFALSMEAKYRNQVLFNGYVVLFGTLHIDQSILGIHANLINGSGLPKIMNHLSFTAIGLSDLTTKAGASSIKRVRYSMQITSCVLYSKLTEAIHTMDSTKSS